MTFFGRQWVKRRRLTELERRCRAYEAILEAFVGEQVLQHPQSPPSTAGIVFSYNRPLQVDGLLSSYAEQVSNPVPLHLLYRPGDSIYETAYHQVIKRHSQLISSVCREDDFRRDLLALVESLETEKVFFLVDDILFVRRVDFGILFSYASALTVVSLRLGIHLDHCYTHNRGQPLPPFEKLEHGLLRWRWREGALDWGYPLSLDGHVFSRKELLAMLYAVDFKAPNSLETALQRFRPLFLPRYGICCAEAPVVNIPFNKVQSEYSNRSAAVDPHWLLEQWNKGLQLDYRSYYGLRNRSAHEEHPIRLCPRVSTPL